MTREEAKDILKAIQALICPNKESVLENNFSEAFDMAIEALIEPINCVKCKHYYETEDDTDVHGHCKMDTAHTDLISRADAIELCAEAQGRASTKSELKGISKVWQGLIKLPSAEAVSREEYEEVKAYMDTLIDAFIEDGEELAKSVKVVRCNECKWYQGVHGVQGHAPCEYFNKQVLWNDFCSWGEPYKGGDDE